MLLACCPGWIRTIGLSLIRRVHYHFATGHLLSMTYGGLSEIRTHDEVSLRDYKTRPFDHCGTRPFIYDTPAGFCPLTKALEEPYATVTSLAQYINQVESKDYNASTIPHSV